MSKIQPSHAERLKALYYKVQDQLDYSEKREFEDLIHEVRCAAGNN